ncbi:MAG: T9SS type A sorting domain-containing protein [Bacteroidota bacterium]
MKKLILILLTFSFLISSFAQTLLTYQTHGIVADQMNFMKLCNYTDPGISGKNAVWDFTGLRLTSDFEGTSGNAGVSEYATVFNEANIVVEEFGNYFFFNVTEDAMKQYGFISADGLTTIRYDDPFVKMKFPFSFGDTYSGDYSGKISGGCKTGVISGNYSVEADGLGTLSLPDDVTYDNALRIRETKSYTQTLSGVVTEMQNVTYRWYINENRLPLLSLIRKCSLQSDGDTVITTQAAYNPILFARQASPFAVNSQAKSLQFNAYPNPFNDNINISFNLPEKSDVEMAVFSLGGKLIRKIVIGELRPGWHSQQLSAAETGLARGTYLLKILVDGVETSLKIVRQ